MNLSDCLHIHLDYETYGTVDLTKIGAYKYAEHPDTDVLCASYKMDSSLYTVDTNLCERWRPDYKYPFEEIHDRLSDDAFILAWNAQFERLIWNKVMARRYDWPELPVEAFICVAAWARDTASSPSKLEMAGIFFDQPVKKDMKGHRLMLQMCKPATESQQLKWLQGEGRAMFARGCPEWEVQAAANRCHHTPENIERLHDYCDDDVAVETGIAEILPEWEWPEIEQFWESERINDRGLCVDVDFAAAAAEFAEEEKADLADALHEVTGGDVTTPRQFARFQKWALPRMSKQAQKLTEYYDKDVKKNTFDADTRANLLAACEEDPDFLSEEVHEAIEILDEAGKSTVSKYISIRDRASTVYNDGRKRVHGLYMLAGGAQTGRYSSVGLQAHNLVRDVPPEAPDMIKAFVAFDDRRIRSYGKPIHTLGKLVRPTITGDPRNEFDLIWGDWSSIEAIMLPWLSLDPEAEDVLATFRKGEDIYIKTASAILGKPPGQITKEERQSHGKVPCIAEGQLVLTDIGLVPIEHVTLDMKVWDGVKFVSHQGTVFRGIKDVWKYDGVVATADHIMWTEQGPMQLSEAARCSARLIQSGAGRTPIRVGEDRISGAPVYTPELGGGLRSDRMHGMWQSVLAMLGQFAYRALERVSDLFSASHSAQMALSQAFGCEASLRVPDISRVSKLRWPWRPVPFQVCDRSRRMGDGEPRAAQNFGAGQERQRRSLRTGQPAMDIEGFAESEQAHIEDARLLDLCAGRMALRRNDRQTATASGIKSTADIRTRTSGGQREAQGVAKYRGKARVYDIVNAGPLHRFTVSGKLVHNCLALGFNGGAGAFKAMAKNYGVRLEDEMINRIIKNWRDVNPWAIRFGNACDEAAKTALDFPDRSYSAGRVHYRYEPDALGGMGALFCTLPSGRRICYPDPRVDIVEKSFGDVASITCRKGAWRPTKGSNEWPRTDIWRGTLVENCTQAACADLLRIKIEEAPLHHLTINGHTHDELLAESKYPEDDAPKLKALMEARPGWQGDDSLPLRAEVEYGYRYKVPFNG